MKKIIFIIIILLTSHVFAAREVISDELYKQIKSISLEIVKKYPTSEYHILAIGRSPIPFSTFLNILNYPVATIPLSGFKFHPDYSSPTSKKGVLNLDRENKLFLHFEKYIPKSYFTSNKPIVLIDYGQTGETIFSVNAYLEKYLKIKYREDKTIKNLILSIPYNFQGITETANRLKQEFQYLNIVDDSLLYKALARSTMVKFAGFGTFYIDKDIQNEILDEDGWPIDLIQERKRFVAELNDKVITSNCNNLLTQFL